VWLTVIVINLHRERLFSFNCLNEVIQEIIMFSLCRSFGRCKSLVHNIATLEGSIAEGYLADEMLTFCLR
jgi:hypothetical protein